MKPIVEKKKNIGKTIFEKINTVLTRCSLIVFDQKKL